MRYPLLKAIFHPRSRACYDLIKEKTVTDNASDKRHDICNPKAAKCITTFFSEAKCCDELSTEIYIYIYLCLYLEPSVL